MTVTIFDLIIPIYFYLIKILYFLNKNKENIHV